MKKSFLVGFTLGTIAVYFLVLTFWAWVLGLILGWFGVTLPLWKNLVIIIFIRGIFATSDN